MPDVPDAELPEIILCWMAQLRSPDVVRMVRAFGNSRRVDLTVYADRGRVPKPASFTIT